MVNQMTLTEKEREYVQEILDCLKAYVNDDFMYGGSSFKADAHNARLEKAKAIIAKYEELK
jgi:hypothetical protein